MARMSLDELRNRASTVDRAKLDATTEAQIEAYRAADGDADLEVPEGVQTVEPPRALRVRLGLTQREMADALRIPLGTWRNWEQGRGAIEPAAVSLLRIVACAPETALSALNYNRRMFEGSHPTGVVLAGIIKGVSMKGEARAAKVQARTGRINMLTAEMRAKAKGSMPHG